MRVKGIARYTHIANPSAPKGSEKKRWSISTLIHKNDSQIAMINKEIEQAKANGFPSGFPANAHVCFVDCAIAEPDNTHLRDYMSLSANTSVEGGTKPHFVDANIQPIMDPAADGNTDGMVVFADVGIASYNQVSSGVKAYLNGVMVTDEQGAIPREALTSKPDAAQMFSDVGASPAATGANPPTASAPPAPNAAPPPAPAQKQMTAKANGVSYEDHIASGWTDELLIQHGLLNPPASFE